MRRGIAQQEAGSILSGVGVDAGFSTTAHVSSGLKIVRAVHGGSDEQMDQK